jgi:dihydroorotase
MQGGLIMDPSDGMHESSSLGIATGKLADIGADLSEAQAEKVFDLRRKIVTPGLIDIHYHQGDGFPLGTSAHMESRYSAVPCAVSPGNWKTKMEKNFPIRM